MATKPTTTVHSFYRPHLRVYAPYTSVNPVTGEVTTPPSMTKQSFVAECDINNIIKQYKQTGIVRHINEKTQQGAYRDLPDDLDFQASMNIVIAGQDAFASLPSKLRTRFGNDPAQFLEFMANPDNQKEAVSLGLANPPPSPLETPPPPPPPPVTK